MWQEKNLDRDSVAYMHFAFAKLFWKSKNRKKGECAVVMYPLHTEKFRSAKHACMMDGRKEKRIDQNGGDCTNFFDS